MYIRTPMHLIEKLSDARVNFLANINVKIVIQRYLPLLIKQVVKNYDKADCYWYPSSKKLFNFKSGNFSISQGFSRTYLTINNGDIKHSWYFCIDEFYKIVSAIENCSTFKTKTLKFGELEITIDDCTTIKIEKGNSSFVLSDTTLKEFKTLCKELIEDKGYIESCNEDFKYHGFY